jgi:hypothetical protein
MEKARTLQPELYAAVAWAALLIWWGVRWLVSALPEGSGLIGTGLILLGLNAVRAAQRIPTRWATTALGILALEWGALELAGTAVQLSTKFGLAILLITSGLILLARVRQRSRSA